ncbi:uncharacterized protein LOC124292928 [Neodiprion lecontei]|uniref:Uncharacterized protein LOC124292928 n=1 Tax=Neodiprion lecontei TaxID=441921 RepID=A0ABM3FHZ2_NEOLC|nr:uncharacterized protein LOC124292928 [Neodiprion lecontei]
MHDTNATAKSGRIEKIIHQRQAPCRDTVGLSGSSCAFRHYLVIRHGYPLGSELLNHRSKVRDVLRHRQVRFPCFGTGTGPNLYTEWNRYYLGTFLRIFMDMVKGNTEKLKQIRIRTGVITNLRHKNLEAFLDDAQRVIVERLRLVLREELNVKVNLTLSCKFDNAKHDGIAEEVKSFNTSNTAILPSSDIDGWFTHARNDLLAKVEDFE